MTVLFLCRIGAFVNEYHRRITVVHIPGFRHPGSDTLCIRVSQYVYNFRFFNDFLIRKAPLRPKSRNKQIFAPPCKIHERKLKYVRIV